MAKYKQGLYTVINKDKYIGDVNKVYYRSSWELTFMQYLDLNRGVKRWSSEEIHINYVKPTTGRVHRYFPDFYMEIETKDGVKKHLLEIKPVKDTELLKPKRNTLKSQQRVVESALTMSINEAKWVAARKWCDENDVKFMVLTEKELFGK